MTKEPRDIQERSFEFGVRVVRVVGRLPRTIAGNAVGQQLVRSGTAIGANMQEADAAESKADFIHKTGIALKEAKETHYWLRIIDAVPLLRNEEIKSLLQEAHELSLILGAIKSKASQSRLAKPPASRS